MSFFKLVHALRFLATFLSIVYFSVTMSYDHGGTSSDFIYFVPFCHLSPLLFPFVVQYPSDIWF